MVAVVGASGAANSVIVRGERGTLCVDAQMSEDLARELLGFASGPPRYLATTHPHGDHTFGAPAFPAACPLIAEAAAEAWAAACWSRGEPESVARLFFGDRLFEAIRSNVPWAARLARRLEDPVFSAVRRRRPDILWEGRLVLPLGPPAGDAELLAMGAAHSPSDAVVWLPAHRVLIAGDLVFSGRPPFVSDPTLRAWLDALDRLAAMKPAAVVPGHGPHGEADLLEKMREQIVDLIASPDPVRQAAENGRPGGRG